MDKQINTRTRDVFIHIRIKEEQATRRREKKEKKRSDDNIRFLFCTRSNFVVELVGVRLVGVEWMVLDD
jgi:hypothetical protein